MIQLCDTSSLVEGALQFACQNAKKAPYLYANLLRYGITDADVTVWVDQEGNQIKGLYLRYYDCLHFLTGNVDYPVEQIDQMIQQVEPNVIMLPGEIGGIMEEQLIADFVVERNYINEFGTNIIGEKSSRVEVATRSDLKSIAELLLTDDEYKDIYRFDTLYKQLCSRFDDHYGRYFMIRRGAELMAVFSTYAEVNDFAILGGLLVHPQYRRMGLAMELTQHICAVLHEERIAVIDFVNFKNTASLALHRKLGVTVVGSLYKFVRKYR